VLNGLKCLKTMSSQMINPFLGPEVSLRTFHLYSGLETPRIPVVFAIKFFAGAFEEVESDK